MGRLDATTRAEYDALTSYVARAALVRTAIAGEVSATVLDGDENVRAVGVMADPWATVTDNTLTIGELVSFVVTDGGTPDAGWVLRFDGGGRSLEGSFGLSGAEFNWSLPTFETGQLGAIGAAQVVVAGREPVLRDTSITWSMNGLSFSFSSIGVGSTFSPPTSTRVSFERPTMLISPE